MANRRRLSGMLLFKRWCVLFCMCVIHSYRYKTQFLSMFFFASNVLIMYFKTFWVFFNHISPCVVFYFHYVFTSLQIAGRKRFWSPSSCHSIDPWLVKQATFSHLEGPRPATSSAPEVWVRQCQFLYEIWISQRIKLLFASKIFFSLHFPPSSHSPPTPTLSLSQFSSLVYNHCNFSITVISVTAARNQRHSNSDPMIVVLLYPPQGIPYFFGAIRLGVMVPVLKIYNQCYFFFTVFFSLSYYIPTAFFIYFFISLVFCASNSSSHDNYKTLGIVPCCQPWLHDDCLFFWISYSISYHFSTSVTFWVPPEIFETQIDAFYARWFFFGRGRMKIYHPWKKPHGVIKLFPMRLQPDCTMENCRGYWKSKIVQNLKLRETKSKGQKQETTN